MFFFKRKNTFKLKIRCHATIQNKNHNKQTNTAQVMAQLIRTYVTPFYRRQRLFVWARCVTRL